MAVVIDLDPLGQGFQPESLGHAFQQTPLGSTFRQPPIQSLSGVRYRLQNQAALFSALGHQQIDLAFGTHTQRVLDQLMIVDGVGQQDLLGRRVPRIKLPEKRRGDLGLAAAPGVAGIVGAIAEILSGAKEKNLHASLVRLLVHRHHVRIANARIVDPLAGLNLG